MRDKNLVKFGSIYKDSITGVSGTATGYCEYIYGLIQIYLEFKNNDGHINSKWIELSRLSIVNTDEEKNN